MAVYGDYGDGTIYNDGTLYGLPSPVGPSGPPPEGGSDNEPAAAVAAATKVRQTGLQVIVQGWGLNNWELFAGAEINSDPSKNDSNSTIQNYWSYRNAADVIQLNNGTIIRVRLGDGSYPNRGVWIQTITDPTDPSQWTAWTSYSASDNFGVALTTDGSTYNVYHTRSSGLFKNGSSIFSKAGLINPSPVVGDMNAVFVMQVTKDPIDLTNPITGSLWDRRRMDLWYSPNSSSFTEDPVNYRWYRNGICARLMPDGTVVRIQTNGMYTDPRAYNTGDSITYATNPSVSNNTPSVPFLIRGLGAQVGHNTVAGGRIFKLSDGFYYLIYAEYHSDVDFETIMTPGVSVVWQRSRDLKHWSEPVFTGFQSAIGGLVEDANYVYFCGNGAVWRRPKDFTPYDISNYVPQCQMNLPRDNQDASASVQVANPRGVNDALVPMAGNVIQIRPGIKVADGTYAFKDFNKWYIKKVNRETNGNVNRLTIDCTDLWGRLDNQLRDTYNWVGKTVWDDWGPGLRNKTFNYYFDVRTTVNFTPSTSADTNTLNCKGLVLYTGWKGHNSLSRASVNSVNGDIFIHYYRYQNPDNNYRLEVTGGTGTLYRRRKGVDQSLASGAFGNNVQIDVRWSSHKIYSGGSLVINYTETDPGAKPGYVGWTVKKASALTTSQDWTLSGFHLEDYEQKLTSGELIKTALAMGDYHDALTIDTGAEQFALIWGPQTDIPTPAVALKTLLDAEKLQLVWLDGAYHVSKWTDNTIKRVLEDEVIETNYTDNANQRINLALVDGNTDTWIEVDAVDTQRRGWQINAYYDAPELLDPASVKARAIEEIRRGSEGDSPGGRTPLPFDLDRMDCITWVDNAGNASDSRIQGIAIAINQSTDPFQRATWDLSLLDFEQPAVTPPPDVPPIPIPPVSPWPKVYVPTTIDYTGATDVKTPLNTFIATTMAANPTGVQIVFVAGGIYGMSQGIQIGNVSNVIFDGLGATVQIKFGALGSDGLSSCFILGHSLGGFYAEPCHNVTVRNFKLIGNSTTPGVYQGGLESAMGILVDTGSNFEFDNVTVQAVYGDGFYFTDHPTTANVHDCHVISAGRNGVSVIDGASITVQRTPLDTCGYMPFDVEPNNSGQSVTDIQWLNGTCGTWTNAFFAADGAPGSAVGNITIDGIHCTGGSLLTDITLTTRRQNIRITNCVGSGSAAGPVFRFAHIDGLICQHNTQALASGSLVSAIDCTSAVTTPNP